MKRPEPVGRLMQAAAPGGLARRPFLGQVPDFAPRSWAAQPGGGRSQTVRAKSSIAARVRPVESKGTE
jgi:hypothetical protein